MNKVEEFYRKAMADESAAKEFSGLIAGNANLKELSDETLGKLGVLAGSLGMDITPEEFRAYLNPAEGELSDDELEMAAGGKGAPSYPDMEPDKVTTVCPNCGTTIERYKVQTTLFCCTCLKVFEVEEEE